LNRTLLLLVLLPSAAAVAVFCLAALNMGASAFIDGGTVTLARFRAFFDRRDYVTALAYTHALSLATTLLTAIAGYPLAAFVARYRGNRNHLLILILMPWLVSIVVRTYGWMVLLGPRGLINSFLLWAGLISSPVRLMFNDTGILIGLVHLFLPFMVLSVLSVFMQINRQLEEAGMSLGARPLQTFVRITLPLSLPGVLSGMMIVYLMSVGSIVTPMLLGGVGTHFLGTQIFSEVFSTFDFAKAAAISLVLLTSALIVVLPLGWLERRVSRRAGR
jgi:putative spermidine/putrescine transport system permease protein